MRGNVVRTAGLLSLMALPLLAGCSEMALLEPKGPIGAGDRAVILDAFGLMLIVVIPVVLMSIGIPWYYRAENTKATYAPEWKHSNLIEAFVWLGPAIIVAALGALAWTSSHRLDPYKQIASDVPPIHVEAVSLDWKWLFIYPELGIATVNQLVFPAKAPLNLRLTSDTVMTAFFIPDLGSQIYSMAGMETKLNLMANKPGHYWGDNTQYSGNGFHNMHFEAKATTPEAFKQWVAKVRQSLEKLDSARFAELEKPSKGWAPVQHFSAVKPKLFESIMGKYMSMAGMKPGDMKGMKPGDMTPMHHQAESAPAAGNAPPENQATEPQVHNPEAN